VVCIYDCYSPDGSTLQCSYYCECQWSDHSEDVVICTILFHFACLVRVLLLIHIIFTWTSCWVEMLWRLTARHRHHLDMARPAKATSQNSPNKPNLRQHKRNQHTQKHNQKTSYPGWPDQETEWPTLYRPWDHMGQATWFAEDAAGQTDIHTDYIQWYRLYKDYIQQMIKICTTGISNYITGHSSEKQSTHSWQRLT